MPLQKKTRMAAHVRPLPPDTERALTPLSAPTAVPEALKGNSRLLWELLARAAPAPVLPVELAMDYQAMRRKAPNGMALPRRRKSPTLDQNMTALNHAVETLNADLQRAGLPYRVVLGFALCVD